MKQRKSTQDARNQPVNLVDRYSKIGPAAVLASVRYQGDRKNSNSAASSKTPGDSAQAMGFKFESQSDEEPGSSET
jgi:hypothetical protein